MYSELTSTELDRFQAAVSGAPVHPIRQNRLFVAIARTFTHDMHGKCVPAGSKLAVT